MARYHINPETGNPGKCSAQAGNCPFGDDLAHYSSPEEAREAYEVDQEIEHLIATIRKDTPEESIEAMITNALNFDSIAEAEELTGVSYKDDPAVGALGMALAMKHNKKKAQLLQDSRDTHFRITYDEALEVYKDLGFEEVYSEDFDDSARSFSQGYKDQYKVLWNQEGILATVESYGGKSLNSSKIYYNWQPNEDEKNIFQYISSGHMAGGVNGDPNERIWVGDHDAREGLRHTLSVLRDHGKFLPQWRERPHLWLINYGEQPSEFDFDYYEKLKKEKVDRLPKHIQELLGEET
jgi:hypothetical protein